MQRTPTNQLDSLSIFCHIMRFQENKTLEEIGEMIGKHHATVSYHLKRYDDSVKVYKSFQDQIKDFKLKDFVDTFSQKQIYLKPLTVADVMHFLIH